MKAEWSCGTMVPGALCVMTAGIWLMPKLCVASWAVVLLWALCQGLPLVQAQGLCGWMKWGAGAVRWPWGTVLHCCGDTETVCTRRMQA